MPTLEFVRCPGWSNSELVVAFVIDGQNVYFTSTSQDATSTINLAEELIVGLCRVAGITWVGKTFFDIQTWRGYYGKRRGYWQCDRLTVKVVSDEPMVTDWSLVARWPYPPVCDNGDDDDAYSPDDARHLIASYKKKHDALPGLPAHILALFQPIIDGVDLELTDE